MVILGLDKGFYPGGQYWRKHNPSLLTGQNGQDKFEAWIISQGGLVLENGVDIAGYPLEPCVMFEHEEDAIAFKLKYM